MADSRSRSLALPLYINAALLAGILIVLVTRGSNGSAQGVLPFEAMAMGQQVPQPIAGGAGFFLMPAQFGNGQWGCYVMDVDAQTLVAYVYNAGDRNLRLVAARSFVYDRQLRRYNTTPRPEEIQELVRLERDQSRRQVPEGETGNSNGSDAMIDATTKPTIPNE